MVQRVDVNSDAEADARAVFFGDQTPDDAAERQVASILTAAVEDMPSDTAQPKCLVCGEDFEEYWSESKDAWLYRDTLMHPQQRTQIVHKHCV